MQCCVSYYTSLLRFIFFSRHNASTIGHLICERIESHFISASISYIADCQSYGRRAAAATGARQVFLSTRHVLGHQLV